jgi:hypothetical protein
MNNQFDTALRNFVNLIVPRMERSGLLPRTYATNRGEFLKALFVTCVRSGASQWDMESSMFNRFAMENLDFKSLTITTKSYIENLRTLLIARRLGNTKAEGVSPMNSCRICKQDVSGKTYLISDLISVYTDQNSAVPVLPHSGCEHANEDGGGWCRCCWRILPKEVPGADPKFKKWLDEEIEKTRKQAAMANELAAKKRSREEC